MKLKERSRQALEAVIAVSLNMAVMEISRKRQPTRRPPRRRQQRLSLNMEVVVRRRRGRSKNKIIKVLKQFMEFGRSPVFSVAFPNRL